MNLLSTPHRISHSKAWLLLMLIALVTTGCATASQAAPEDLTLTAAATVTPFPTLEVAPPDPTFAPQPSETTVPTATIEPTEEPTSTPSSTPTETPEPTETPTPTATATPDPNAELEYQIASGDTLGAISIKFGIAIEELLAYNGLEDANLLRAGSILRIPLGVDRIAAMRATTTAVAQATATAMADTVAAIANLPPRVVMEMTHTYQRPNNCAPSATSMALSVLGVTRTQAEMANLQKPNPADVNVTAEEVAASIRTLGIKAFVGVNGNIDLMQRLIAAGFPVMTEEWMPYDSGMGHFRVLRGYDRDKQEILYNDSYYGPALWRSNNTFLRDWKPFNNKYVIPYRAEQEALLSQILGTHWNRASMIESLRATSQAQVDANPADGYGWWGLGDALLWQGQPQNAITAYERALATNSLPWRFLWYHYGYFDALNQVGRYEDLLNVTQPTLGQMKLSEDLRYHRAVALNALGRPDEAITELRRALQDNPTFAPASALLSRLGG